MQKRRSILEKLSWPQSMQVLKESDKITLSQLKLIIYNWSRVLLTTWKFSTTQMLASMPLIQNKEEKILMLLCASHMLGAWVQPLMKEAETTSILSSEITSNQLKFQTVLLVMITITILENLSHGCLGITRFRSSNSTKNNLSLIWWCQHLTLTKQDIAWKNYYLLRRVASLLVQPVLVNQLPSWTCSRFSVLLRKKVLSSLLFPLLLTSQLRPNQREFNNQLKRNLKSQELLSELHQVRELLSSLMILTCQPLRPTELNHRLSSCVSWLIERVCMIVKSGSGSKS